MRRFRIMFFLLLMVAFCANNAGALFTAAKVTIKVLGEDGVPIEGANVGVGFNYNTGWGTNSEGRQGLSDGKGLFAASGQGNGHISYGADKEGYYDSYYGYDFQKLGPFGWEPKNPELIVVLRKIGNPAPMYARDTTKSPVEIPVVDKDVGFDLVKFDWVAPYGAGVHSDFVFHLKRQFVEWNNQNSSLVLIFSNKNDGILRIDENLQYGSDFKLPRFAPEKGYVNKLELFIHAGPNGYKTNVKRSDNYIFRIRSKVKDGELVEAMYGKILGSLDFSTVGTKTATIHFKYYLNPDGTRNLEYDPERNLFTGLPPREWVGIK